MGNQERIAKLLRYATSTQDGLETSFEDYKARMKEGQKAIYYLTADNLAAAKTVRNLSCLRKKAQVILMTSRVDEWAMNFLTQFDETPLQNIAKVL